MIYVLYFFSGAFLVNMVPHFVHGVSGKRFQSPFGTPPGVGESSPLSNLLWGVFNFVVGYALLNYAGFFTLGLNLPSLCWGAGFLITAVFLAVHFDRVRNSK